MTTPERKALLFLAAVGVLGAGARLVATPAPADTPQSRAALARQLDAVDSARRAEVDARGRRRSTGRASRRAASASRASPALSAPSGPSAPVDVDVATAEALEALPGIGPALARRIVDDRSSHGAFGSAAGLQRVRGVGAKLAERLAPHVTFSGTPRLPDAAARRPP